MPFESGAFFENRSRKWWISLFLFLFLLFTGSASEFAAMTAEKIHPASETAARYEMMLFCFALLLIYVVPFFIFVRYSCQKMNVPKKLPVIAFFSGWFLPGWIAGELNDGASDLISFLVSKSFNDTWGDAIEAPIVEESVKVLVVVWLLVLIGRRLAKDYLITGMCVGMGFQVSEDFGYIEDQVFGSHADYLDAIAVTLGDRIAGGLVSHWAYTAVVAAAVWMIFRKKKRKAGILLLLVPVLNHALWDSPLTDTGVLALGVLEAFMFLTFLVVWEKVLAEERRGAVEIMKRTETDAGGEDENETSSDS